jgi:hypothetical protein
VGRVPVAPEDVVAHGAGEAVAAVVPEQLVVGLAAGLGVGAAVEDRPEHAGDGGPAGVRDLRAAAGGPAAVAGAALLAA